MHFSAGLSDVPTSIFLYFHARTLYNPFIMDPLAHASLISLSAPTKTWRLGLLMGSFFCISVLLWPMSTTPVGLTVDFIAPSSSGYAQFQGRLELSRQRSLLRSWTDPQLDVNATHSALREAVTQALSEAPPDVVLGFSPQTSWTRRLAVLCEQKMAALSDQAWSARVIHSALFPASHAPDPDRAKPSI